MRTLLLLVAVGLVSPQVSAESFKPRIRGKVEVKGVRELSRSAAGTKFRVTYVNYSNVRRLRQREITVKPGAQLLVGKSRSGDNGRSWSIAVTNKGAGRLKSIYHRGNEMQYAPLSVGLSSSYAAGGKTRIEAKVFSRFDSGFLVPRASKKKRISKWKSKVVRDDCGGTTCWSSIKNQNGSRVAQKLQVARTVPTSSKLQTVPIGTFNFHGALAKPLTASVVHNNGQLTRLLTETSIGNK